MICAYCQHDDHKGQNNSHGVCPSCYEQAIAQIMRDLQNVQIQTQLKAVKHD